MILNNSVECGTKALNLFVDKNFFKGNESGKLLYQTQTVDEFLCAFINFIQGHFNEVMEIIANYSNAISDKRTQILELTFEILKRFWGTIGIDLIQEAQLPQKLDFSVFFDNVFDEEDILKTFIQIVRKEIQHFCVLEKGKERSEKRAVCFFDSENLWFHPQILDRMLGKNGMLPLKLQILSRLKEAGALKTDKEGLTRRLQVDGARLEFYQFDRAFFNEFGVTDVVNLGKKAFELLRDMEGNTVHLLANPNPHFLILGRSGAGKTYFSCRKIEEGYENQKHVYVFDYSSSYALSELEKNHFQYTDELHIINPMEKKLYWYFSGKDIKNSLVDALLRGLKITSYYQKRLLRKGIGNVFEESDEFSLPSLVMRLERMYFSKEDSESQKNVVHLLNRFEPFCEIEEVIISAGLQGTEKDSEKGLTIIQLSDYSEIQRKFLTEFLAELFWEEARYGKKKADIVLFDEFQNMEIKRGSAFSAMLREGRKFGLSVYLSTQFLGNYDKESVDTLMQVGNIIFFKPTEREIKSFANMIDPNHPKEWRNILNKLKIGEAVIKGSYCLNAMKKEIQTPILCKVEEVKTHEI